MDGDCGCECVRVCGSTLHVNHASECAFFSGFFFYLLVCGSGNVQKYLTTQKHKKDIENTKRDTKQHKMDKDCVCECVGAHCM